MAKALGITAFVLLLISLPIPILGNYVSLLAVLILAGAALAGEKMWVIIVDLLAWVKMFVLSPTWHIAMFGGSYLRGMANSARSLGGDPSGANIAEYAASTSLAANHVFLFGTILILLLPPALLLLRNVIPGLGLSAPNQPGPAPVSRPPSAMPALGEPRPLTAQIEPPVNVQVVAAAPAAEPLFAPQLRHSPDLGFRPTDGLVIGLALLALLGIGAFFLLRSGQPADTVATAHAFTGGNMTRFRDMQSYCTAVGTIDAPDSRYMGPEYPAELAATLHTSVKSLEEGVASAWRCAGGRPLACGGSMYPDYCDKADTRSPTKAEREFCSETPNAEFIPYSVVGHGTVYDWSCQGTAPIAGKQTSAIDAQGFAAEAWRPVN